MWYSEGVRAVLRRWAAVACLAGAVALLGTAGARWVRAVAAQREVQALAAEWGESMPAETEPDSGSGEAPDRDIGPGEVPESSFTQGEPAFHLEIPAIGVTNVVVYGTSETALNKGPGLVERTALPGRPGNAVVAAHRDYYFWRLGELQPGDQIRVTSPDGAWTYVVTGRQVVKETDTTILDQTPEPALTLFTCWPLIFAGRSPERLVVTAALKTGL